MHILKKITVKRIIQHTKKQQEPNQRMILKENLNGEHQMMVAYQNKIGENIPENLKKEIRNSGKSMRGNFGKTITHMFILMEKMENMKKHKNQKNNQMFLWM